jgi:Holliday junction DNA helicase RuvA
MIATLTGQVSEKLIDKVVIEVSGVGYGVFVTNEDYNQLSLDETVKLIIYEYVREQAHDLFGFIGRDTQNLFERLLEVSGVGPKMALSMLSVASSEAVRKAISSGDVAFLQQANGVGRRLAERVIVELKDKVGFTSSFDTSLVLKGSAVTDEAVQALMSLGFSKNDAALALNDIDPKLSTEERVKVALKGAGQ